MIGSRLGTYEITAKLGEGGMGEVYRATDTKLHRDVAIKVLPAAFTEDKERLQRVEREAQLLAQLHHPNIASIFGLEESGANRALVMELVEGPTLADRLQQGALPIEESLSIARQIAEALEEAHEKGIVHRDLKPQNIKASIEGKVKVLDFGLAKAMDPVGAASGAPSGSQLAASPTLTLGATVQGVILGTAAYMSPEQAKGLPVDKRADIWAFGVVLYEMLVGGTLFAGDTVGDTLAAVIRKDVDLAKLPEDTPSALRRLLRRCLERNPKNRLHSIADARIVIEEVLAGRIDLEEDGAASAILSGSVRRQWSLVALGLLAGALGSAVLFFAWGPSRSVAARPPIRAAIEWPDSLEIGAPRDRALALSPDGSEIALVLSDRKERVGRIHLRRLDELGFRPLPGTEEAIYPFWSPDGRALAFFADGKLKRLDLASGIVRTLCDAPQGRGGDWSPLGTIVFSPGATGSLSLVSAEGGAPVELTTVAREGEDQRLPHFLPDGETVLFQARNRGAPAEAAVYAFDPATRETRKIVDASSEAVYVEPGYLAYLADGNLMLQPFDAERMRLSGLPRPIAAGVSFEEDRRWMNADLEAGGRLVYLEARRPPGFRLFWVDAAGNESAVGDVEFDSFFRTAKVSPDGRRVAISDFDASRADRVELFEIDLGTLAPLGERGGVEWMGSTWSPDGERVAALVHLDGQWQLGWTSARSGEAPRALTFESGMEQRLGSFTPDGRSVLFAQFSSVDKIGDLFLVDLDGGSPPRPFLAGSGSESFPLLSPDARWVGYLSDAGGRSDLWVTRYPEGSGSWQVTTDFAFLGDSPYWGWMGPGEIWWYGTDDRVRAVTIRHRGDGLEVSNRRILFGGRPLAAGEVVADYSIVRERFLMARDARPGHSPGLIVLTDWLAELGVGGRQP